MNEEEKPKLLLDEMYTGLDEYFEVMGWDVTTVEDAELKGAEDKEVVNYAGENNLVLVTKDHKPAQLAEIKGIHYVYVSKKSMVRFICSEVKEEYG